MKTYTILERIPARKLESGGWQREQELRHKVSEQGALLIWAAYHKLYGNCQTMERRQERGGIAWVSEIAGWIERGALPKGFDWTQYKVAA